jgi:glucose/arabinose dehydrogenase
VRRRLTPADMPVPLASPPAANQSHVVARQAGAMPKVPPGFAVDLFATGLSKPRVVRVAPNGDIFVAESGAGRVSVFRAANGAATPSTSEVFASNLNRPFGIAFYPPGPDPHFVYVDDRGRPLSVQNRRSEGVRPA